MQLPVLIQNGRSFWHVWNKHYRVVSSFVIPFYFLPLPSWSAFQFGRLLVHLNSALTSRVCWIANLIKLSRKVKSETFSRHFPCSLTKWNDTVSWRGNCKLCTLIPALPQCSKSSHLNAARVIKNSSFWRATLWTENLFDYYSVANLVLKKWNKTKFKSCRKLFFVYFNLKI